ncbi:hypothetical protein DFJ58DRAFT_840379 [Suillus subalutaceus]|uniref:uncharacterized protein n=1 Tax=Suillus subalutaceus TaxID=48586 RepID=UPI001B875845|nr:uncharacterized protein DFJ58DRAFT_840379 [Suillus subalutaceus]KAG1858796.1 hypothetical protein DFJ58DRAFT_840379 [Suillus subalutaceus]
MLFPWERYHNGLDALPFFIDTQNPSAIRLQSKRCLSYGTPCDECTEIPLHVKHLADIARTPRAHTNYKFLGLAHVQDITRTYAEQIKQLKLQIVNVALRNGASIHAVVNKLEDALEGVYHPQGYDASDLDIAMLVYRLGGHQLLFALSQKLTIPSLRTLRTRSAFTVLTPTIGPIHNEHFDQNIHAVVLSNLTSSTSLCGVSLMIDEIALEEMAVHFSKYNKVGSLCWKHSHLVDPVLQTYESAVNIAQKIHNGEVHLGKELTVIGASWNATGAAAQIGPVWSLATDGDATRRAASHKLFLKIPLPQDSPLFGTLINMLGLNLFTGDNEVTLDFDFKHIFKHEFFCYRNRCICTLLWSPTGVVLNNGRIINSMMLARYLMWLPAYDEAAVTKLLHPDDPQDVPRAVKLILAIIEFSKLQHTIVADSFSTDIETRADLQSITLLSALLESIVLPFTDISLSLSEQTMTKNSMFCIAKQQALDSHAPFFLGDVGDDPLKIIFGHTRIIGGHNSASSYAQALDCLGTAKDIDGVFRRHPNLDPGHWRLKLTRQEGVDHINSTSQLDSIHYSFAELFNTPRTNMLRPFGDNKYLGISQDELQDASDVPKLPPAVVAVPPLQCLEMVLTREDGDEVRDANVVLEGEDDDDKELMLNFQEALIDESTDPAPSTQPSSKFSTNLSSPPLPQGPMINKDFISKSLNQLEHIRGGFTKVNKWIDMSVGRITDCNLFLVGDIFLTILHSSRTLSIRVLRSTAVTLNALRTTAKITGQLLTIIPTHSTSSDVAQYCLWDGGYVTACSLIPGTSNSTEHVVIITVPGTLIEPVNPETTFICLCDDINTDAFSQVSGGQSTWQVSRDALQAACDILWAKAVELKVPVKSIASVTPVDIKLFPYQFPDGTPAVIYIEASVESSTSSSLSSLILLIGLPQTPIWQQFRSMLEQRMHDEAMTATATNPSTFTVDSCVSCITAEAARHVHQSAHSARPGVLLLKGLITWSTTFLVFVVDNVLKQFDSVY